jgi:hypothetical protein
LFALGRGVPVGRVFPSVLVFQLCLGVLGLLVFGIYVEILGRICSWNVNKVFIKREHFVHIT